MNLLWNKVWNRYYFCNAIDDDMQKEFDNEI